MKPEWYCPHCYENIVEFLKWLIDKEGGGYHLGKSVKVNLVNSDDKVVMPLPDEIHVVNNFEPEEVVERFKNRETVAKEPNADDFNLTF